ncbi:hypothetical protein MKY91_03765 [Alkalicoccobacillus gibsonii]|uniref:Uncharacterized protein n=1 Tax=Alkalicoccobacillus gibsonii TaxID=79881 RepID=A0ABU9VEF2_9BACI
MRKYTFTDDELIRKYIIYSTMRNVINRKNRGLGLKNLIEMGNEVGNEIHNMQNIIFMRKIKIIKTPSNNNEVYAYTLFKNGWRSEHTMEKSIINDEVKKLWNDLHKKKD